MNVRIALLAVLAAACSSTTTSSGSGAVGGGAVDIGGVSFDAVDPNRVGGGAGDGGLSDGSGGGSGGGGNKDGSDGTAGFGEPCQANIDCKSGYYIDGYAGHICSQTCNGVGLEFRELGARAKAVGEQPRDGWKPRANEAVEVGALGLAAAVGELLGGHAALPTAATPSGGIPRFQTFAALKSAA
jgi:hypothetical protein